MSPGGKASRAKGDRLEYAVVRELDAAGWWTRRAPRSAFPDIVAVSADEVAWIECKTNGRLDPHEWNALFALAMAKGGVPVLASREDRKPIVYRRLLAMKAQGERRPTSGLLDEWKP